MKIDSLEKIPLLYHFTDKSNLPLIEAGGGLYSWSELRKSKSNVPAPGGNDWSHDADDYKGLSDYVHLCFKDNHPMEYTAKQDGRIKETVWLKVVPAVLQLPGVLFTPDVSNKSGVVPIPIADAANVIDFDILYTWLDWKDPAILERLKKAQKYEVLVPKMIPINMIGNPYNG